MHIATKESRHYSKQDYATAMFNYQLQVPCCASGFGTGTCSEGFWPSLKNLASRKMPIAAQELSKPCFS